MPWINEIRTGFERLNASVTPRERREQGQRHRRFSNAAMSAGYDQPWMKVHGLSKRHVKIYSHASKHRPDGSSKKQHFFVLLVEDVVRTHICLHVCIDIVGRRQIPH